MSVFPVTISYPVIKVTGKNKETITVDELIIEEVPYTVFLNGQEQRIITDGHGAK